MNNLYILNEKNEPVLEPDLIRWGKWFGTADRTVKRTEFGEITLSTVFLGLDHNFFSDNDPILFETMIFGGENDQRCWRHRSWEESLQFHEITEKALSVIVTLDAAEFQENFQKLLSPPPAP